MFWCSKKYISKWRTKITEILSIIYRFLDSMKIPKLIFDSNVNKNLWTHTSTVCICTELNFDAFLMGTKILPQLMFSDRLYLKLSQSIYMTWLEKSFFVYTIFLIFERLKMNCCNTQEYKTNFFVKIEADKFLEYIVF